ncbi:hypothetical protein HDU97_005763 [Phlyctochytrium planicorne]|nr:hypothetical protein HDU97_005763 [Phlyctochytrium planicorne]
MSVGASSSFPNNGPDIPREILNRLIYEHLVHHCYSETATSFSKACQLNGISKKDKLAVMDLDGGDDAIDDEESLAKKDEDVDMMEANDEASLLTMGTTASILPVSQKLKLQSMSTPTRSANAATPPSLSSQWSAAVSSLEARKHLHTLLVQGKVAEAVHFCKATFGNAVLSGNTPQSMDICFQLQCQQFIENVRVSAPEAVKFAQTELRQFGILGSKYVSVLQDIVALIAYKDPLNSPVAHYLSQERREEVASNVNSYILATETLPQQTAIERLISQMTTVGDYLNEQAIDKKNANKVVFPKFSFEAFVADVADGS